MLTKNQFSPTRKVITILLVIMGLLFSTFSGAGLPDAYAQAIDAEVLMLGKETPKVVDGRNSNSHTIDLTTTPDISSNTITSLPTQTSSTKIFVDFNTISNVPEFLRESVMDALTNQTSILPPDTLFYSTAFRLSKNGDWARIVLAPSYVINSGWENMTMSDIVEILAHKQNNNNWNASFYNDNDFFTFSESTPSDFIDFNAVNSSANLYRFPWTAGHSWWKNGGWHGFNWGGLPANSIDFQPKGSDYSVLAASAGLLDTLCVPDAGGQMWLKITNSDGASGYGHLSSSTVRQDLIGQSVGIGQYLGSLFAGQSGCGTGSAPRPHLHFVFPNRDISMFDTASNRDVPATEMGIDTGIGNRSYTSNNNRVDNPGGGNNPPAGYTFCADEGSRCNFSGTANVVYGALNSFTSPRSFTNGVDCNNAVFGDPISGTPKACYVGNITPPSCNPNADQVALFVDPNYGGTCVVKGMGNYPNPGSIGIANDSVSSIKVGGNVKLTLCRDDNYSSTCETFQLDDSNLSDNGIGDNQVSSAKVESRGTTGCNPNADQIALFVDPNYGGACVTKGIGNYPDPGSMGISNDSVSSVKVGGSVKLTLCRDDNYASTCETFQSDDSNLSDNGIGDNQASSAKVETRTPPPSANFDAWPLSGNAPFTTAMHIVSMANITSCSWNYGDGQTSTTCTQLHDHTYSNPGSYTVTLTVNGPGGSDSMTRTNYITVNTSSHTLSVSRTGTGSGTLTGNPAGINCGSDCSENYAANTNVTLTATPAAGSAFTGWTGGGCSGSGTCTLTMNAAKSVSANFNLQTFTLSVNKTGNGSGTVTSNPAGINCGSDCSEAYTSGTPVTLTPTAASGSTFTGWSGGGCSGTGTCTVIMTAATSVTANFAASCPTITNWKGEYWNNPSLSGAPVLCRDDAEVNFDWGLGSPHPSIPDDDFSARWTRTVNFSSGTYRFYMGHDDGARLFIDDMNNPVLDKWTTCCEVDQLDMTLPAGNHVIKLEYFENGGAANVQLWWERIYTLTVNKTGGGSGTVTSDPPGIDCGSDCSEAYTSGTPVTLTATAASGSTFTGWSGGGCSGIGACTISMTTATSVTAQFTSVTSPDLIIQSISATPSTPSLNGPVNFTVRIKNQGTGDINSAFYVDFYIDNQPGSCPSDGFNFWTVNSLAAGATQDLTFTYNGFTTSGAHNVYAFADSYCQISESNENNNTRSISVPVSDSGTPTPIFADDFEAGNFSRWPATACVTDGGDLSVTAAAKYAGNYGMQAVIDDNAAIYCTSDHPNAETRYQAGFRFHPNSIPMASGNTHLIFGGYSGSSTLVFRVQFRKSSGNYQVQAGLLNDGSTWRSTSWQTISGNGYHLIELDWKAATAAGANNGSLIFKVDGVQLPELTGVDNDTRRIDRVRLGAVNGIDSGTRGTTYFDDFASDRGDGGSHPTAALTVSKTGAGNGTVTSNPTGISCGSDCSEIYTSGTSVTLTASAATGSIFTGWSGGGCSGSGTCTVTLNSDTSVTANFNLQTSNYTLSVNKMGTGSGTVTSSPPGIDCGTDCSETYISGTSVTLTATPLAGSIFTGWSGGGCSGTSPCTITLGADTSVNAEFTLVAPPPDLVIQSITPVPGNPPANQPISFSVTIKNQGQADTDGFWVDLFIDAAIPTDCSRIGQVYQHVAGLPAGSSVTMIIDYAGFSTTGSHAVNGIVDTNCDVTESNENNNTRSINVNVSMGVTDVIFSDGFESGNSSAWSSCTTDSGDLSVTSTARYAGNYGMQALLDDNTAIYCTSDHPNAEPRYRARFYFDPNSIAMVNGDTNTLIRGYSGTSTITLRVEFGFSAGAYQIRAGLLNDGSTWTDTAWYSISDAPHSIELDWRAATAAGANDGGLTLWIDGVQQQAVTGIDNDTRRLDRTLLGAAAGIDNGTRGTYYFDAFESRRQTYIGP